MTKEDKLEETEYIFEVLKGIKLLEPANFPNLGFAAFMRIDGLNLYFKMSLLLFTLPYSCE